MFANNFAYFLFFFCKKYKGAGESGKSTVAKQMKIIHLDGFSEEERNSYKSIIYNNTISSMKNLVNAVKDLNLGNVTSFEDTPTTLDPSYDVITSYDLLFFSPFFFLGIVGLFGD